MTAKRILGVLAFVLAVVFLFLGRPKEVKAQLRDASESYRQAEKAETVADRAASLNQALSVFSELEKSHEPTFGNGKLYFNLGNVYYQLEQYPMAIYYFAKAKILMPRNALADQNLNLSLSKMGVKWHESASPFRKLGFFHDRISLPERLQAFFAFAVLTFILASLWIWFSVKSLEWPIGLSGMIAFLLFCSILYSRYWAPIEGVAVQAALLYRGPGNEYPKLSEDPLTPGSKVAVLGLEKDGDWIKISTSDGTLGYVFQQAIRLL